MKCNSSQLKQRFRMHSAICIFHVGLDGVGDKQAAGHAWLVGFLALCISGCSQTAATPAESQSPSLTQSMFFGTGEPLQCPARCILTTIALARAGLGLDPGQETQQGALDPQAIFESLEKESREIGSTIVRVPVEGVIENLTEGPAPPTVFVHKAGHLYVLFGAIRVNDTLLCQVVHGDEAVSLLTKQAMLEGGFQEAWRLEKKKEMGVPIHIGSAIAEINKLSHNFGEVFPDKSLECVFHLRNTGRKPVVIDKPVVSCQCTVPSLTGKTELGPGEALDLRATTNATGAISLRNLIGLVLYEKGSGKSRQVQLTLIGSQRQSMEIAPKLLDFGVVAPGRPCKRLVSLRERPTDRFLLKEVDPGKLPIIHKVEVARDKDGLATYRVQLELNVAEGWSGEHREQITLTTDSYVRPTLNIPVRFQIEPPVRAIPSVFSLGTVAVGEPQEQKVELICRNGGLLDVQVESHPKECSITLNQSKHASEMIVVVTLKDPGIWQGVITLRAITASQQQHMIEIRCAGYGQK